MMTAQTLILRIIVLLRKLISKLLNASHLRELFQDMKSQGQAYRLAEAVGMYTQVNLFLCTEAWFNLFSYECNVNFILSKAPTC